MPRTLFFFAMMFCPLFSQGATLLQLEERRVRSESGEQIQVACRGQSVSVEFLWLKPVGQQGTERRHLFYAVNGDAHVLLPVVAREGNATGFVHQSAKAKALLENMLAVLPPDQFSIGVFPEAAEVGDGKWMDAAFSASEFRTAVAAVAAQCNWKPIGAGDVPPLPDVVSPAPLPRSP